MEKDLELIAVVLSKISIRESKVRSLKEDYGIELDHFDINILDEVLTYLGVPEDNSLELQNDDEDFFCRDWYIEDMFECGSSPEHIYSHIKSLQEEFTTT